MKRFLGLLKENKGLTIFILAIYYFLIVLPHELVGKFVVWVFRNSTREVYQNTILSIGVLLFAFLIVLIIRNIKVNKVSHHLYYYFLLTFLLIVVAFKLLIIHNVEAIHFAQYFVFAILLFPLLKSPTKVIFWSTIAGSIDEMYQYFYLAPKNTDYFDFNDIVLNQLGAGLGLIFVLSVSIVIIRKRNFKIELWTLIGIVFSITMLFILKVLTICPTMTNPDSIMVLVKKIEPGFWTTIKHLHVTYHVIKPLEGVIAMLSILMIYSSLEFLPKKK